MCPKCDSKTQVKETRERYGTIYRRRRCPECGHGFYTEEKVLPKCPALLISNSPRRGTGAADLRPSEGMT